MSNEPTPDTPDADDPASTPVEPSATDSHDPAGPETETTPPSGDADPTVDVISDFTPAADEASTESATGEAATADESPEEPAEPASEPAGSTDTGPTDAGTSAAGSTDTHVPPAAPPYTMVPPVRRLVRDPYSRLGGVCSGIAHHTGVDVSLVRLGFVLATLFSGIGLILYILAWLIVPRAEYWPPAPYEAGTRGSILQGRQLAYGLLAIGIILVVFAGAGGFARMVVSIGLVGAGIYLLVQPQAPSAGDTSNPATPGAVGGPMPPVSPTPGPVPATAPGGAPTTGTDTGDVPAAWQPAPGHVGPDTSGDEQPSPLAGQVRTESIAAAAAPGVPPTPVKTVYVPSPVPPRRRRIWPFLLIIGLLLIPVIAIIGGIAFIAGSSQDFSEADVTITPATAADIPGRIDEGAGTITLDLTNLDVSDFSTGSASVQQVEIDLNAGEIVVDLPPDLPVIVDASASAGEITVLDRYEDGIRPRITTEDDDAVLDLDIRVGLGSITVDN